MARQNTKRAPEPDNSKVILDQLVPPERRRHGIYEIGTISVTEGELGPGEKGERSVVINRGSTTIDRWNASGSLTASQMDAIKLYRWAWHLTFTESRVTMNWDVFASIPIRGGLSLADFVANGLEAKRTLADMDLHVFGRLPHSRFNVWQNVVIYDAPAGEAGKLLGYKERHGSQAAALSNCQFIADLIATEWRL